MNIGKNKMDGIKYSQHNNTDNITTIKGTNQKAEIIDTSLRMLYNNPINISICLLQVCQSFLPMEDTPTWCAHPGYFN